MPLWSIITCDTENNISATKQFTREQNIAPDLKSPERETPAEPPENDDDMEIEELVPSYLSFVPAHVFSSPVVKGVAIGITQSIQFFGLHTFCPQNIWPLVHIQIALRAPL